MSSSASLSPCDKRAASSFVCADSFLHEAIEHIVFVRYGGNVVPTSTVQDQTAKILVSRLTYSHGNTVNNRRS
jgi:hypothetical protein